MIQMTDLTKTYRRGQEDVQALKGVTLTIAAGEFMRSEERRVG